MVLETEVEGLMVQDSERILERESPETRLKINLMFQANKPPDFHGTKDLSPAGPLTICGRYLVIHMKRWAVTRVTNHPRPKMMN